MPEIEVVIPLADIYADIELGPLASGESPEAELA